MKFLTKINRNYLILLSLILLTLSVGGYFVLRFIIINEAKENLLDKEFLIEKQIRETGVTPYLYPIIEVVSIKTPSDLKPVFKEIYINNELEDEFEPFLEYSTEKEINGSIYSIKIRQSAFEFEDLILILAVSLFVLLLSAFGISFLITKKINKTVWSDFEQNLREIEQFNFSELNKLNLITTNIEEFDRLNNIVNTLTQKLSNDFQVLKEFTENASHEIQTPLTIVLLNLEELLQQDLSEEAFKMVISTINAIKQLSSLNNSLILMTKIENRQFKPIKNMLINEVIKQKMEEFKLLFESKNLAVTLQSKADFNLLINDQLSGILVGNLLSNAIHYNIPKGTIQISISENEIKICNTGEPNTLNNENIFSRFAKGNAKSIGLGLAIVKNICQTHNLEIKYHQAEFHCFTISKKSHQP